jgi:hypothetical protein
MSAIAAAFLDCGHKHVLTIIFGTVVVFYPVDDFRRPAHGAAGL